jgi:hypothetical protein
MPRFHPSFSSPDVCSRAGPSVPHRQTRHRYYSRTATRRRRSGRTGRPRYGAHAHSGPHSRPACTHRCLHRPLRSSSLQPIDRHHLSRRAWNRSLRRAVARDSTPLTISLPHRASLAALTIFFFLLSPLHLRSQPDRRTLAVFQNLLPRRRACLWRRTHVVLPPGPAPRRWGPALRANPTAQSLSPE